VDLCGSQRGKSGHPEENDSESFWRGIALKIDTRLRVGRAIGKDEEEVATAIMSQIRDRCNPEEPPAIASDGNDSYPQAKQCLKLGESCRITLVGDALLPGSIRIKSGNVSK
jgi:hypothetical protein